MKVTDFIEDRDCFDILGQKIHFFCPSCGEQKSCPEFNKYGLPICWFRCECGEEVVLPSKHLSTKWWESFWSGLMEKLQKLDPSIHQKLPVYIIQRQKKVFNIKSLFEKYQSFDKTAKKEVNQDIES